MKIHRPLPDHTAARITNFCPPVSGKERSQKNDRTAHPAAVCFRYMASVRMGTIQIQIMIFPPCFCPQRTKNFFHIKNIRNSRTGFQYTDATMKKCSRHQRQHRIFRTLNGYISMKTVSPDYVNFIQTFHSLRDSCCYYMQKTRSRSFPSGIWSYEINIYYPATAITGF